MKMLHQYGVNACLIAQENKVAPNCNVVPVIRHNKRQPSGKMQLEIAAQSLERATAALDQLWFDGLVEDNVCREQISLERAHRLLCELKLDLENIKWYRNALAKDERITEVPPPPTGRED